MEAGLAVPDWPSSFGSFDPIATGYSDPDNPNTRWWHVPPVLAEHGHRLLGALVGLWVVGLALWTWKTDQRRWMHFWGFGALGLVILQGVLGGLRVEWKSLELAVVHAMGAQLFFATAAALTLFTSRSWQIHVLDSATPFQRLRTLAVVTAVAVYVQILLGALLRHPGAGIDLTFILVHVTGSVIALSLILATCAHIRNYFSANILLRRGGWIMMACLIAQMILGMFALMVILYDASQVDRSLAQVIFSSAHLVVGTLLMGTSACVMLCSLRPTA